MSHTNESCRIRMSHVAYKWVMSHTNESCRIRMSHVAYEWVMSHTNESCRIWMSHVLYEMPQNSGHKTYMTWLIHMHINESCRKKWCHIHDLFIWIHQWCHIYDLFICDITSSPARRLVPKKSCHIWMAHVTYEWVSQEVMSHIWLRCWRSHFHMNGSCCIWIRHVAYE